MIPTIDISALRGSDAAASGKVAREVGAACRGIGFFAITGHGVAPQLLADTFAASRRLFAMSAAQKAALAIGRFGPNRGYVGLGVEALDERKPGDRKEAFNLVWSADEAREPNAWPPLPGWRELLQRYFDATLDAGRLLHRAFALDLGLPPHFFDDKLDHPQATLRLLHYPAQGAARDAMQDEAALGAGTHTDYGNVTLLATDGVAGLQVRRRDVADDDEAAWLDVPAPPPGAFICNIGDCLMRWTNDVYVSTPHRVRQPRAERYSIALFVDPNADAQVEALPSCVAPGAAPRYAPISAGDYLKQRLAATYAGGRV